VRFDRSIANGRHSGSRAKASRIDDTKKAGRTYGEPRPRVIPAITLLEIETADSSETHSLTNQDIQNQADDRRHESFNFSVHNREIVGVRNEIDSQCSEDHRHILSSCSDCDQKTIWLILKIPFQSIRFEFFTVIAGV
jgi:hypothetical protein